MIRYFLIAAAIQALWGLTPAASRIVLNFLPVELYAAIRYSVSGILFLTFSLRTSSTVGNPKFLSKRFLMQLVLVGVLTYGVNSLGTLYGLRLGGVLHFSLASSMNALVTAVVSLIVLRESPTPGFRRALLLSVAGGLLLFWGKATSSNFKVAASSLILIWLAYVCESLGFVYSKKWQEQHPLHVRIGIMQIAAGAFLWIVYGASATQIPDFGSVPTKAWGALAFTCFVSCGLCYYILYWLLTRVEGHRLAFFDCFHTIVSALVGVLLFQESFNSLMIGGGILLVAAVFVITLKQERNCSC